MQQIPVADLLMSNAVIFAMKRRRGGDKVRFYVLNRVTENKNIFFFKIVVFECVLRATILRSCIIIVFALLDCCSHDVWNFNHHTAFPPTRLFESSNRHTVS